MIARWFHARAARAGAAFALALLGACSTQVVNTGSYAPPPGEARLPRPQKVLVADFAADTQVRLDQGIGPRLERLAGGGGDAAAQRQTARQVQDALAETLVADIRKMGLPAERVSAGEAARLASPETLPETLIVQGQLSGIDEGNRTRRIGIGFGAGKSEVSAEVQVLYASQGAAAKLLQTYDAESNSGRKPGMAAGAGAAAGEGSIVPLALTTATGAASETRKSPVAAEAGKLADRVAYNLGGFFVRQGWIAEAAAPSLSLR